MNEARSCVIKNNADKTLRFTTVTVEFVWIGSHPMGTPSRGHGGMVDAPDLKSVDRKVVRVQVPLPPSLEQTVCWAIVLMST